jgi:hypothetical protein
MNNGIFIAIGAAAVGIGLWILLTSKTKAAPAIKNLKPSDSPLNHIYDPKPKPSTVQDLKVPLAPDLLPPLQRPSFYTTDHYDGPIGVAVPEGTIKPNYRPNTGYGGYVSSVDLWAPGREVMTSWQKIGLLIEVENTPTPKIMNLYGRPIAPLQDLYQYQVQDKDDFVIPLNQKLLEDGDFVYDIPGKPGKWRTKLYQTSKYIWM